MDYVLLESTGILFTKWGKLRCRGEKVDEMVWMRSVKSSVDSGEPMLLREMR